MTNEQTPAASDRLTDDELAAIAAATNAATPGPWRHHTSIVQSEAHGKPSIATCYAQDVVFDANMDFIAGSRTWVPALLAEVDRLRVEVDRLTAQLTDERTDAAEQVRFAQAQNIILGETISQLRVQTAGLWPLAEALAQMPDQLPLTVQTHQYHEAVAFAQRTVDAVKQARTLVAQRRTAQAEPPAAQGEAESEAGR